MTMSKHLGAVLLTAVLGLCALGLGGQVLSPSVPSFISTAEAVVGRPLTPVSVAGSARRTSRRCAAGVYDC
jgi:hypothetical protein